MNLTQLRHFYLVFETGSFAAAAGRASITQPALSNSIRTLEERIGVTLVDRRARPIKLTSAGREVLGRARKLLQEANNLETAVRHLAQGVAGHLKVGMSAVSSASVGGDIFSRWLEENPAMSVDLIVGDTPMLLGRLYDEELDLIIGDARDLPTTSAELELVELPVQMGAAFCRAGHPLLENPAPTFRDLLPYRFAGSHFPTVLLDQIAQTEGLSGREEIQIAIDSDNLSALRDTTAKSDIVLLTTPDCVRDAVATNVLQRLPIDLWINAVWKMATLRDAVEHPAIPSLKHAVLSAFGTMATR